MQKQKVPSLNPFQFSVNPQFSWSTLFHITVYTSQLPDADKSWVLGTYPPCFDLSLLTVCTISSSSFMNLLFPGSMMPFFRPPPSPTILVLHPDCLSSWNLFLFLFPSPYGKAQGKAPLNIYELSLCTWVPLDNLSLTPSRIFKIRFALSALVLSM